jgi:hypothetical protein
VTQALNIQSNTAAPTRCGIIAALCAGVFRRLFSGLGLHVCGIYSKELKASTDPLPEIPGLSFQLFDKTDAELLIARVRHPELDLSEQFIHRALAKGDVCAAILCNDEVVSYIWLAFTPTHDTDGVYITFREGDLYCYKALTLPEFRGRRLPRLLGILTDRYCVTRGCTHTIAYIDIHNQVSIRAVAAQGGCRIGFAGYLKRGPIFVSFRTQGVRRCGFRFFMPDRKLKAPQYSRQELL